MLEFNNLSYVKLILYTRTKKFKNSLVSVMNCDNHMIILLQLKNNDKVSITFTHHLNLFPAKSVRILIFFFKFTLF